MTEQFQTEILDIRKLTSDVTEFVFRPTEKQPLSFQAGQYVMFVRPIQEGESKPLIRAYSIASPPYQGEQFSVVANLVPDGRFTPWLFSLKKGDYLTMRGPKGQFVLSPQKEREYYFIATGTGIAPLRAMILELFHQGTSQAITLLWGLRSEKDLYFQNELDQLAQAHANFSFIPSLSRASSGWSGAAGRVTHYIDKHLESVANREFYLCGNGEMIKEVKAFLQSKGLCIIHTEKFF